MPCIHDHTEYTGLSELQSHLFFVQTINGIILERTSPYFLPTAQQFMHFVTKYYNEWGKSRSSIFDSLQFPPVSDLCSCPQKWLLNPLLSKPLGRAYIEYSHLLHHLADRYLQWWIDVLNWLVFLTCELTCSNNFDWRIIILDLLTSYRIGQKCGVVRLKI